MEVLKIVALSIAAACLYGVIHDQITARICIEYFTIGHPPIFGPTQSPTLLGLGWGIVATWWVGLPLGFILALACRVGSQNKRSAQQLIRPLGVLLLIMGCFALLAGIVGYLLATHHAIFLIEPLASQVPQDRHARFLADGATHLASYASGILGGIILSIYVIVKRRSTPSNAIPASPVQPST